MSIELSDGTVTVNLPPDLYWADEFSWHPVERTKQRTLSGALVISSAARIGGRPITLQPFDDRNAWMPHSVLEQLRQWAAGTDQALQLTLRGVTRNVVFDHGETPVIEAKPVKHMSDVQPGDWYEVTLRLMEN